MADDGSSTPGNCTRRPPPHPTSTRPAAVRTGIRGATVPAALLALLLLLTACGNGGGSAAGPTTAAGSGTTSAGAEQALTLYTCVSDSTIQPVLAAFSRRSPHTHVDLFRAPTGQLDARVAADVRSGGLRADVLWACDPLTQQAWVDQGLTGGWTPPAAAAIPVRYRTRDYVGVAVLYMVAVTHTGVPAPAAWSDLTGPAYAGGVAVPDPSLAASALGALGWFAADRHYGLGFYRQLKSNGAVQVSTPDDVTTGVAQGRYKAGITTANSAYAAKDAGSPVAVTWPEPGAIAVYGPVALAKHSAHADAAKQFISYVAGPEGQQVLATAGSYPTLPGVQGPPTPADAPVVLPDWPRIATQQTTMLADYQRAFVGG
jgi:iron(III) transport system substrate-binding protein